MFSLAAKKTFNVPLIFTSLVARGLLIERSDGYRNFFKTNYKIGLTKTGKIEGIDELTRDHQLYKSLEDIE